MTSGDVETSSDPESKCPSRGVISETSGLDWKGSFRLCIRFVLRQRRTGILELVQQWIETRC